jgi:formylglycine-generating enzyme required for sulfatase activity
VRYGDLDKIAWYSGNSGGKTHGVGQKQANKFGLYDMLGNVSQWTGDWFGDYSQSPAIDPSGPPSGQYRVLRGGSWYDLPWSVRASYRVRRLPTPRFNRSGFRCAGELH